MNHCKIRLKEIAYARSGDKGADVNIGIIAFTEEGFNYLRRVLKEKDVLRYFHRLEPEGAKRYELPNLFALNFVFEKGLGEGGSRSLRLDAQGKALGQAFLEMEVLIPVPLLPYCLEEKEHERRTAY